MRALVCKLSAAGVAGALSLALPNVAFGADAGTCRTQDPMRSSMIAKADQGADALRRYAFITRSIHQQDATEVANAVDAWRAQAGCAKRVAAQGSGAAPVASLTAVDEAGRS